MTSWMMATVALIPALAIPALAACRGSTAERMVAVQLATSVAVLILVPMTFAFDQSAFADLAATQFMHQDVGAILGATAPPSGPLMAAYPHPTRLAGQCPGFPFRSR